MIPRTTVDIGNDAIKAVKRVIERGQYVKGAECEFLEKEFSEYQGVKFSAGVNSGTSALHLALLALGIKRGDEVITTPNTFAATVNTILMVGGKPRFVDIDPETFTMDVSKLKGIVSSKTKAIVPVHLYGLMTNMGPLMDLACEKDLFVLEDACQAHGAKYHGKRAGVLGDAAVFSFFPTKNVTVAGDGGIVLSNNKELIETIKSLRDHGRKKGKHIMPGLNNRLSEILAAIGREHLKNLDSFNEHRRKIAKRYNELLGKQSIIKTPSEPDGYFHVYHLYTIKINNRDKLRKYLLKSGIQSKIMYPERLNELNYVREIAGDQKLPVNDAINKKILSLPISGSMKLEDIEKISLKVLKFYNRNQ